MKAEVETYLKQLKADLPKDNIQAQKAFEVLDFIADKATVPVTLNSNTTNKKVARIFRKESITNKERSKKSCVLYYKSMLAESTIRHLIVENLSVASSSNAV